MKKNSTTAQRSADTGATRTVSSNQQGEYSVPALLPGPYNITIQANGFKTVHQNGVVVEVEQRARVDFALTIGSNTDSITVQGSAPLLNTSDASVSTLIGNRFVENMPLNGRSFSSLIDLTPGVVLTPSNFYDQGQFSVNGQRPDANYFLVDGVGANLGTSASNLGQGGAGQLPATSTFGGTSNLVSLDALEEFRIQTSTFAPEYGELQELRYQWSLSPAQTFFTVRRSSTSVMTSWMPTIGSPTATLWRGPNCGRMISAGCWAGQSKKTSCSSSALTRG